MPSQKRIFNQFLDSVPDEKLQDFSRSEATLFVDYDAGYRLDYQGTNGNTKEKPYIHRLYVQPVGGSKSKSKSNRDQKNKDNSSVTARCHASDQGTPSEIREGLWQSYLNDAKIVGYAPPK